MYIKKLVCQVAYINACSEKQRITRKKKANEQTCFSKNHEQHKIQTTVMNDPFNELLNKAALK